MNLMGEGTKENDEKALIYFTEGYKLKDLGAIKLLAQCYENVFGVAKDKSGKLMVEVTKCPFQTSLVKFKPIPMQ